ncbi:22k [Murine adenovirus 3]|uniref:22k n=1 Tax=Murine adenovirus 3 TaxID=573199 RepID=C3SAV1_9ADEN|nr:22k [Murine adenovirus 3]ACJ14522.1 22k [Murine adenovirus 3]
MLIFSQMAAKMQSPEKITTPFTEEEEGEWMTDGDSEESGMSQQSWQEEEEQIAPPQIAQKRRGETAKQKKGSQSSSVTAVNSTGKKTRPRWDFPPAQNKLGKANSCNVLSVKGKHGRQAWKNFKGAILQALFLYGGDRGAVRRYLLFNRGTLVPRRVISYYCRRYYSQPDTL